MWKLHDLPIIEIVKSGLKDCPGEPRGFENIEGANGTAPFRYVIHNHNQKNVNNYRNTVYIIGMSNTLIVATIVKSKPRPNFVVALGSARGKVQTYSGTSCHRPSNRTGSSTYYTVYIGSASYFIMVEICCANQSEYKFLCFCGSGISIGPSLNPHSLSLNKILVTLSL